MDKQVNCHETIKNVSNGDSVNRSERNNNRNDCSTFEKVSMKLSIESST